VRGQGGGRWLTAGAVCYPATCAARHAALDVIARRAVRINRPLEGYHPRELEERESTDEPGL
jgi:hypothetical protein